MKKLVLLFALVLFTTINFVSCTPEALSEENETIETESTGQGEIGDPSDDDDEEGGN